MAGIRREAAPSPGLFARLTRPELIILAAKLHTGKSRARMAVLRGGTPSDAWSRVRLASQLAQLADDVEREIADR